MKKLKKWVLILAMVGPAVVNTSCSSMIVGNVRDAVFSAVFSFVELATFDILDRTIQP